MSMQRFLSLALVLLAARPTIGQERNGLRVDGLSNPLPLGAVARLGTIRLRGDTSFNALVFTPDGEHLVTGSYSNKLHYWEVATGKKGREITVKPPSVYGLQFSADGKLLAVAGGDGSVRLLDAATGVEKKAFHDQRTVGTVRFCLSPDGKTLVTAHHYGSKELNLWDAETGKLRKKITGLKHYSPAPVVFLPDSKQFLTLWTDSKLHLVDVRSGASVRDLEKERTLGKISQDETRIHALALSSEGKKVVFRPHNEQHFQVVDVATGQRLQVFERDTGNPGVSAQHLHLTANDRLLVEGGADSAIRVWGLASGKQLRELIAPRGSVQNLALSRDGKKAACTYDHVIFLWDLAEGEQIHAGNHQGTVYQVAFSPDGKHVVSAGRNTLRVWEAGSGKQRKVLRRYSYGVEHLRFSADGTTVLWVGPDRTLYEWKWQSEVEATPRNPPRTTPYYSTSASSRDARWLAGVNLNDRKLLLIDLTGSQPDRELGVVDTHNRALVFSPDGETLLTTSGNRFATLYNVKTGQEIRRLPPRTRTSAFQWPAFSNCGRVFLGPEADLRVIESLTGKARIRLEAVGKHYARGFFSPDGRLVGRFTSEGEVIVHDLWTRQELLRRNGQQGHISALAFSPDGRRIATGGANTTILIWEVPVPDAPSRRAGLDDESAWRDLGNSEAARAFEAMVHLAASPATSVALLRQKSTYRPPTDAGRIARLIAELDHADYAVREKASDELGEIGHAAEEALKAALKEAAKEPPALEVQKRITALLEQLQEGSGPGRLRAFRTVEVLEMIRTREARDLLRSLAREKPQPRVLEAIQSSLSRMEDIKDSGSGGALTPRE